MNQKGAGNGILCTDVGWGTEELCSVLAGVQSEVTLRIQYSHDNTNTSWSVLFRKLDLDLRETDDQVKDVDKDAPPTGY